MQPNSNCTLAWLSCGARFHGPSRHPPSSAAAPSTPQRAINPTPCLNRYRLKFIFIPQENGEEGKLIKVTFGGRIRIAFHLHQVNVFPVQHIDQGPVEPPMALASHVERSDIQSCVIRPVEIIAVVTEQA